MKLFSRIRAILLLLPFALLVTGNAFSQVELPQEKVKWKVSVQQDGCDAFVCVEATMVKGWHIYAANLPEGSFSIPSTITFKPSKAFTAVGRVLEPKPHFYHDEAAGEDIYSHDGKVLLRQKIKVLSDKDFTLSGVFGFQTCDDVKCLPPFDAPFSVKVKGCPSATGEVLKETPDTAVAGTVENVANPEIKTLTENAQPEATPPPVNDDEKQSLVAIFVLAFLAGFTALIMPCVFPMIPMTVSFFTKRSRSRSEGIRNAFLYGGSIVLIHVLLGGLVVITGAGHLLNELSTNVYFNIFFFLMLFVFGLSFLGAFEIQLPSSWVNSADAKADKGGIVGIFFMALVLSLASFSCTGPILGSLLGALSATGGGTELMVGMFAFGLALALPFMLFAIFPSWLNSMPSSGGWLNVVKVFLGFLEIAFAFKFLSTADTTMQWHLLEREVFIAIWIAVFGTLGLYMLGKIRLPHDSPVDKLSVGRTMIATLTIAFTMYLIPGLWGAPLKLVNAFLPPDFYAESPEGLGGGGSATVVSTGTEVVEGMHKGPRGLMAFTDYDKALDYAKKVKKPLLVDFTGWGCVNCRKMEQSVWGKPGVIEQLRDSVVIVSLYVDERTELPKDQQSVIKVNGNDFSIVTVGNKWTAKQIQEFQTSSQPYYVMIDSDGKPLSNGSADYQNHGSAEKFKRWLDEGVKAYR